MERDDSSHLDQLMRTHDPLDFVVAELQQSYACELLISTTYKSNVCRSSCDDQWYFLQHRRTQRQDCALLVGHYTDRRNDWSNDRLLIFDLRNDHWHLLPSAPNILHPLLKDAFEKTLAIVGVTQPIWNVLVDDMYYDGRCSPLMNTLLKKRFDTVSHTLIYEQAQLRHKS